MMFAAWFSFGAVITLTIQIWREKAYTRQRFNEVADQVDEIRNKVIVATAFAQVARDIARRNGGK